MNIIINTFNNFLNRLINGIYPEQQSMYNYNKDKREELNIINEEKNINNIIDNQLLKLKEEKLTLIKKSLILHTKLINNIIINNKNEYNLITITRIYYILYNLIKHKSFLNNNKDLYETNKKLFRLEKYINGLTYTSPFDNEEIIINKLCELYDYLSFNFTNNNIIKKYVEEDISNISLSSIIKNIINL